MQREGEEEDAFFNSSVVLAFWSLESLLIASAIALLIFVYLSVYHGSNINIPIGFAVSPINQLAPVEIIMIRASICKTGAYKNPSSCGEDTSNKSQCLYS